MSIYVAKDFTNLSSAGKIRRVRKLAAAALSHYDISVSNVHLYCFATNLLYQVLSDSGERFMLSISWASCDTTCHFSLSPI